MKKILLIICCAFKFAGYSQPGSLDLTFGAGGIAVTDFGGSNDAGLSVVIQNDGKIMVGGYITLNGPGGDFALARYNFDGSLDSSFGAAGKIITDMDSSWEEGAALAVQPDGKILLAGSSVKNTGWDFSMVRYQSDGGLDSSFAGNGKVRTDFGGSHDLATAVALQQDGKILLSGWKNSGVLDFALARYTTNGNLDSTFGANGKVFTDFGGQYDYAWCMAVQNDGKIIVAGSSDAQSATNNYDFALARYTSNGTLDPSFGAGGKVLTDFLNSFETCYSLLIQPDGKILAAGFSNSSSSNSNFCICRYNADGTMDASFGLNGKVITDLGTIFDWGFSLALQSDGKILLAGSSGNGSSYDFALVRYNTNGSIDSTFDSDGKVFTPIGVKSKAYSVAVTAYDRIVVAGSSDQDFALARYFGCGQLTPDLDFKPCRFSGVGIQESQITEQDVIYPNPCNGIFKLELNKRKVPSTVCIYDLLGNCVFAKNIGEQSNTEIDIRSQARGVYLIEVLSGGTRSINKLVLN